MFTKNPKGRVKYERYSQLGYILMEFQMSAMLLMCFIDTSKVTQFRMTRHWSECLLHNKKRWKEKAVQGTSIHAKYCSVFHRRRLFCFFPGQRRNSFFPPLPFLPLEVAHPNTAGRWWSAVSCLLGSVWPTTDKQFCAHQSQQIAAMVAAVFC